MGKRFYKKKHRRNKNKRRAHYANNLAENAVVWVCERWLKQGKIIHYIHSYQSGQLDKDGVDIDISLKSGFKVPVQVTSKDSDEQVADKRARHFKLHPHVKILLVVEGIPQGYVAMDLKIYRKIAQDLATEINELVSKAGNNADKIDPDIGEP